MRQLDVYYQLLSQHVSGIIMLIFRRTKTVCYCIRCTALFLLDVVECVVGCEHCSHPTTQRPTTATNHIQQNQHSTPYAVTHGLWSPEDGHNDARNMLRQKLLIINIWLLHLVGFFSLSSHFAHVARSQEPKSYMQLKKGRLTGLVERWEWTAFSKTLLKERKK